MHPPQRQRLAWPQAGVREDGDERRIADAPAGEQHEPDRLDALGRERHDRPLPRRNRLAHDRGRVRREAAPLAGALQHALKQHQRLADRCRAHAVGLELEPEPVDHVRRQLAQRHRAEPREHVCVPDRGVALERRPGEVRLRVQPPPLLAELGERLLAGVEPRELAGALAPHDLGVEGLGVALAPQDLGAVAAGLAPAHAPDDAAVLAHDALDAHDGDPPSNSRRKLPRTGGGAGGGTGTNGRLTANGRRRDPRVERLARDPQPRAQAHRAQLAAIDGAVDRPGRQAGKRGRLARAQEDGLNGADMGSLLLRRGKRPNWPPLAPSANPRAAAGICTRQVPPSRARAERESRKPCKPPKPTAGLEPATPSLRVKCSTS